MFFNVTSKILTRIAFSLSHQSCVCTVMIGPSLCFGATNVELKLHVAYTPSLLQGKLKEALQTSISKPLLCRLCLYNKNFNSNFNSILLDAKVSLAFSVPCPMAFRFLLSSLKYAKYGNANKSREPTRRTAAPPSDDAVN